MIAPAAGRLQGQGVHGQAHTPVTMPPGPQPGSGGAQCLLCLRLRAVLGRCERLLHYGSAVSQSEVPIVSESVTTTVTYARKRDIRRRHSCSIGACGRSCSVDKHLKERKLEGDTISQRTEGCQRAGQSAPGHVLGRAWPGSGSEQRWRAAARDSPCFFDHRRSIVTQHTPT